MKKGAVQKKNQVVAFLILFFCCFSILIPQQKAESESKSFFWQLDFNHSRSHILGSIHFLKKSIYPLKNAIETAFDSADALVVEADISAGKMGQHLRMTMEKSMYSGDENLEKNLSPKTFKLAGKVLKNYGIDIQFYQKFKPWFLAMTISGLELMKLGLDPNFGVDKYFIDKVYAGSTVPGVVGKTVLELEGIEYQINLLDQFTRGESENFLFYSLQEVSQYPNEIDEMVKAWSNGDVPNLERILNVSVNAHTELISMYKKFIDIRNLQMAEKIFAFLKTKKIYFIVVGAAHLIGNSGILQLLRKKGVEVKQI